jgi:hypothetical protein
MSERNFHLRMQVAYQQPDNAIASLKVQKHLDGEWQDFVLNTLSPGFEIFVYSMFTCQHTYFRLNAAEKGLVLGSAEGEIRLGTDEQWQIDLVRVDFHASVAQGEPTREISDYIVERMQQCPVSKNTREVRDLAVSAAFDL